MAGLTNFDLKIGNYNNKDLESILGLQYPYSELDLQNNVQELIRQVSDNNTLGPVKTEEIVKFLKSSEDRLSQAKTTGSGTTHEVDFHNNPEINTKHLGDGTVQSRYSLTGGVIPFKRDIGRTVDEPIAPIGSINPINTHTITKLVNIDTQFRENYYTTLSTDLQFTLPMKLERVIQMSIQDAIMPISWYAVSENRGNNKFCIDVIDVSAGTLAFSGSGGASGASCEEISNKNQASGGAIYKTVNVTIPNGNYTSPFESERAGLPNIVDAVNDAMMIALQAQSNLPRIIYGIDKASGKSYFIEQIIDVSGSGISPSYIPPTYRLSGLRFNVTQEFQPDYLTPIQQKAGWMLGFRNAEYLGPKTDCDIAKFSIRWDNANNASSRANLFISEGIPQVKGPSYGYITVNDFNNNVNQVYTQAFSSSLYTNSNVMSKISLAQLQASGSFVSTSVLGTVTTRTYFGPVDIQRLHIQFLDEYGQVIDLNNMDWSFTLSFILQYDKSK
tara:strand:- start:826 stop:2328 length:1503 start_codon:yes stop_codon:yes gene_type:complete